MMAAAPFPRSVTGRHVLIGLVIFFGIMFVANGLLVYYAVSTFSGGDRPNPYRSGLNYNETIAEAEQQAALGWSAKADYDKSAARVTLHFADSAEAPVTGLALSGKLVRPTVDSDDRVVTFREWREGVYVSDVTLDPGNWILSVESAKQDGGSPVYRLKKRLIVADGP
ncbi:FixH family protein [Methyloceanibacter sp. wino2]|uniref:FixH family protein n=1 Tax=Methyloceanibacter sp. wino2 TaxID=2170729 RepID=UPI000D3E031E|nr:FixH family protein [Methyloceanibacter sp. wino2]